GRAATRALHGQFAVVRYGVLPRCIDPWIGLYRNTRVWKDIGDGVHGSGAPLAGKRGTGVRPRGSVTYDAVARRSMGFMNQGWGMEGSNPMSVVLQHENRLVREMLAGHLEREPGIVLAGTAPSGPELIQLCNLRRPAVVVYEADTPRWSNERLVSLLL